MKRNGRECISMEALRGSLIAEASAGRAMHRRIAMLNVSLLGTGLYELRCLRGWHATEF